MKEKRENMSKKESTLEVVDLEKFQASKEQRLGVLKTYKIFIDGQFPRTESGRYYALEKPGGELVANVSLSSRKDFRNAVTAARKAFDSWAARAPHNRGQILYRMAEMLEGRREQFISELCLLGSSRKEAEHEVDASIDRLVYYAGWSDKYQQIFSAVNPVSSSHFNFSVLEPMGVIATIAPQSSILLGLVSVLAPQVIGGNTVVVLAAQKKPLAAVTLAEVLATSDLPAGVINILTGSVKELASHFASHMDVNAVAYFDEDAEVLKALQTNAIQNLKRVINGARKDWNGEAAATPYMISDYQEVKTTWHPIGV